MTKRKLALAAVLLVISAIAVARFPRLAEEAHQRIYFFCNLWLALIQPNKRSEPATVKPPKQLPLALRQPTRPVVGQVKWVKRSLGLLDHKPSLARQECNWLRESAGNLT